MAESRSDLPTVGTRGTDRLAGLEGRVASPALTRTLFRLHRPSRAEVAAVARANANEPYGYRRVGATGGLVRRGVTRDAVFLGHGATLFQRGVEALKAWAMLHHVPWIRPMPLESPPRPGQVVALASHQMGFWSVAVGRVLYVVEPEDGSATRYGFAIGSLRTHPLPGEERYTVEWDRRTDAVHFQITRFCAPAPPPVRLLLPLARHIRRRFTRDALEALRTAVESDG